MFLNISFKCFGHFYARNLSGKIKNEWSSKYIWHCTNLNLCLCTKINLLANTYMKLVMKIFELGKVYKPSQPASAELLLLFWKELNHCHVSVVLWDNHGDLKKYRRPIDFPQSIMTKQKLVNIEYILKYIWTLLTHLRFVKHKPPVFLLGLKNGY